MFDLVANGYTLASSLHADTVDEVFEVLGMNGVPTAVAATVPYLIKVRMLRNPAGTHVRRVVDEIHEITPFDDAEPTASLLYRWDGVTDDAAASWIEERSPLIAGVAVARTLASGFRQLRLPGIALVD